MASGSYVEFGGDNNCVLYGPKGELIATVKPDGAIPILSAGENQIVFSCSAAEGPPPRVKLTVISYGESL
jgi:hypothetical protein